MDFMEQDFFGVSGERLLLAGAQTVYMLGWSMLFGAVLGIAIALLLVMTRRGGLTENRVAYSILNFIINVTRSVPFIILLVALIPFTRFVVGTSIGSQAALVPLTIYITPFIARMVESSLLEVKPGVIEAAQAMGATNWQIIRHFLLPEAYPSIVLSLTTSIVGLLGATAMAGYGGG
ncbi:methionine ABC transporter permease, partial [Enteractinococcus coprophilus]